MNARLLWFRRIALFAASLAAIVVVLGAWVRLTDAGLGCPDWPGCYGHWHPAQAANDLPRIAAQYPDRSFDSAKAWHEMIHRYFATTLGIMIAALLAWAVWNRADPHQPLAAIIGLFLIVCLQGALGAFTVTLLLKPLIVTAHLLGGLSTLGLLCWLARDPERRQTDPGERNLRRFAWAAAVALLLQIALGGWTSTNYAALACPDFPTCQGSLWPAMDFHDAFVLWRGLDIDFEGGVLAHPARMAIHYTHRLGALVVGTALFGLGWWASRTGATRQVRMAGRLVLAAVLVQIAIGVSTVQWGVPLALATLHNAGAAFLVIAMANLLRALSPLAPD